MNKYCVYCDVLNSYVHRPVETFRFENISTITSAFEMKWIRSMTILNLYNDSAGASIHFSDLGGGGKS